MDSGPHRLKPDSADNPAGRVIVDARGRNVWQWKDEQLDSTTIMLRKLDNSSLALEPTRQVRKIDDSEAKDGRPRSARGKRRGGDDRTSLSIDTTMSVEMGGGFNPYDHG
jgi:hypothetical protein